MARTYFHLSTLLESSRFHLQLYCLYSVQSYFLLPYLRPTAHSGEQELLKQAPPCV